MARVWPLMERTAEFDSIRSALVGDRLTAGAVVIGPAGVGKTTLARLATETIPGVVRWVAGTESSRDVPLGAFAHLIAATTTRDPLTILTTAREAVLAERLSVLGVDDAHLLDSLSATLLHQLAIDRAVPIVATIRSGEPAPDAVTALWKDDHLSRLDLEAFDKEQSIRLVERALDGPLEDLTADLVWQSSGGNGLFLRHLVEGALDAGTLRESHGVWQLRGTVSVTGELASILDSRIDALPEDVRSVLEFVAFCEPIALPVLATLVGDRAIEDAEGRGLVRVYAEDRGLVVQFIHPLFGEVVRRRVGTLSARRLRGQLVDALSGTALDTVSGRILFAELALDSDRDVEPDVLSAAAADAVSLADVALSERLARASLERGGGVIAADLLARSLLWQGCADEVEETLARFAPDDLGQVPLLRWGCARIANFLWSFGDADRADELISDLRSRLCDRSLLLVLSGVESACALHENRLDAAVAAASEVMSSATAPPSAVEWAAFGGGRALAMIGRGDEVDDFVARMRTTEDRCDGLLRYPAALGEILALTLTGRLAEATDRCGRYSEFGSSGQYLAWALAQTLEGTVLVARGRLADAVHTLEQALAAFPTRAAATWSLPATILLGEAYASSGRAGDAARVLDGAASRMGRHVAVFEPQLMLARAKATGATGAVSVAIRQARESAEKAAASGQFAIEAEALHTAARFGDRSVDARLAELSSVVAGSLVHAYARHASAVAAHDAAALEAVAERFVDLDVLLSAADAAAQAATASARSSDRRAIVRASATASRLAAACGGARTPAIDAAAHPLPLTDREREIANLVEAGLAYREIADRLTVSLRTVEGHVYRMSAKLGVADRTELAELIRRTR